MNSSFPQGPDTLKDGYEKINAFLKKNEYKEKILKIFGFAIDDFVKEKEFSPSDYLQMDALAQFFQSSSIDPDLPELFEHDIPVYMLFCLYQNSFNSDDESISSFRDFTPDKFLEEYSPVFKKYSVLSTSQLDYNDDEEIQEVPFVKGKYNDSIFFQNIHGKWMYSRTVNGEQVSFENDLEFITSLCTWIENKQ